MTRARGDGGCRPFRFFHPFPYIGPTALPQPGFLPLHGSMRKAASPIHV